MEAFEPPKYITSLIAAINDGAKSAQLGALAFTAIGLFLLATAFSATDEDLLLNRTLTISQLGAAVPVVFAFGLAPTVFVAVHFYTLIRYDMLAGNIRQFVTDLSAMVPIEADRNRCRQLLANVEFVNSLAMPKWSRTSSWMFDWTVRALLAVFPVGVLLFVQLQSLRLQNEWVTWTHHICIFADLVLLVWFFARLRGDDRWHFWRAPIRRKVALCWLRHGPGGRPIVAGSARSGLPDSRAASRRLSVPIPRGSVVHGADQVGGLISAYRSVALYTGRLGVPVPHCHASAHRGQSLGCRDVRHVAR